MTNPELVRPLRRGCWFVRNKDYNAYNTLAVVDTLQKRYDEKDMMTEAEILAARAPAAPTPDAVTNRSRKGAEDTAEIGALRREGFSLRRSTTAAVIHFRVCCRVPARRSELLPVLQKGDLYDLKRISKAARPSHVGFPVGRDLPICCGGGEIEACDFTRYGNREITTINLYNRNYYRGFLVYLRPRG